MPTIAQSPEWTPERDAKLIKLWPTGLTNLQMAAQIGGFEAFADKGRTAMSTRAKTLGLPPKTNGRPRAPYKLASELEVRPYTPGRDPRPALKY